MKVTTLDEKSIHDIGHAFGYYDYGEETGMSAAFSGKEATANYICAYVRGVMRGGFLHTTGERGEGYIAYKLPKEKMGLRTMWPIKRSAHAGMYFSCAVRYCFCGMTFKISRFSTPKSRYSGPLRIIRSI